MEDFTLCSYPGVEDGRCYDGVCLPAGCGNGVRDPEEMCDDGNTRSEDGCSADCTSDEVCGTGVPDLLEGEACDDGDLDLVRHDGCTKCALEVPRWRGGGPAAREGLAMAYDSARNVVVMFGGRTASGAPTDTWEWTGSGWRQVVTPAAPSGRIGHSMGYDARRRVVVLFGGSVASVHQNDTWEWDGVTWTRVSPTVSPSPRTETAIAYDAARGEIVLYGGHRTNGIDLYETWTYDGVTWSLETPATLPNARRAPAMAYDAARKNVVLFGSVTNNDTWLWNGVNWTRPTVSTPPSARGDAEMAYDPIRGEVVLFGGRGTLAADRGDTHVWNGSNWSPATGTQLSARHGHAMAFDGRTIVVFSGFSAAEGFLGDTSIRSAGGWRVPSVPKLYGHASAYDAARGNLVVFGGQDIDDTPSDEMWLWQDSSWRQLSSPRPPPRAYHAMAYDRDRRVVVVYGGTSPTGARLDDHWEWDGVTWTQRTIPTPPARASHALAYDAARKQLVLFGGDAMGASRNDTWIYDGTTWREAVTPTQPPARTGHGMVYDPTHGVVVLAAGSTLAMRFGDTWTWDGTTWTLRPETLPPRSFIVLCHHLLNGTTFAFGVSEPATASDFTWQWDGTSWTELTTPTGPPSRFETTCAFDETQGVIVVTGGLVTSGPSSGLDDTWELRYERLIANDPDERCLLGVDGDSDGRAGCEDPDCAPYCTPGCPHDASCPEQPHCGDLSCNRNLETVENCPADCSQPPVICGDFLCSSEESIATCPGDCT